MIIGSNIIYYEKLSSTNDTVAQILKQKKPSEGTVIYAGEQSHGKGQRGNRWESDPGKNLTMSVIIYPDFLLAEDQFYISKLISLGITDYLDKFSKEVSIKWPNDIYVFNDKIAGILIENSISGNKILDTIAGVGLNINQLSFSPDIPNAVSMTNISGVYHPVDKTLNDLCKYISIRYDSLKNGGHKQIDLDYRNKLFMADKWTHFSREAKIFKAAIRGVNKYGHLLLENEKGKTESFAFNEIRFVL